MSGYNYKKFRKLNIPKQWEVVKKKARLNDIEVAMAMSLRLSPKTVLSMVSNESWKDTPALRIRRLYDEKHLNPALEKFFL